MQQAHYLKPFYTTSTITQEQGNQITAPIRETFSILGDPASSTVDLVSFCIITLLGAALSIIRTYGHLDMRLCARTLPIVHEYSNALLSSVDSDEHPVAQAVSEIIFDIKCVVVGRQPMEHAFSSTASHNLDLIFAESMFALNTNYLQGNTIGAFSAFASDTMQMPGNINGTASVVRDASKKVGELSSLLSDMSSSTMDTMSDVRSSLSEIVGNTHARLRSVEPGSLSSNIKLLKYLGSAIMLTFIAWKFGLLAAISTLALSVATGLSPVLSGVPIVLIIAMMKSLTSEDYSSEESGTIFLDGNITDDDDDFANDFLTKITEGVTAPVEQDDADSDEESVSYTLDKTPFAAIFGIIVTAFTFVDSSVSGKTAVRSFNEAVRIFKPVESVGRSFGEILEWVLKQLPDAVREFTIGKLGWFGHLDLREDAKAVMGESYAILRKCVGDDSYFNSQDNSKHMLNVYYRLLDVEEGLVRYGKRGATEHSLINRLRLKIASYTEMAKLSIEKINSKPVTTGVWFQGISKIGKTSALPLIAAALYPDRPTTETIYPRASSTEYWTGYTGQPIVYYDDPDAVSADRKQDFLESNALTYMSNTFVEVPMARLEEKGRLFSSEILIATSNKPLHARREVLQHEKAFHNRFEGNTYEVILREEYYAEPKSDPPSLNREKVNALDPWTATGLPFLHFKPIDAKGVKQHGVLSFKEVVERIRATRDSHYRASIIARDTASLIRETGTVYDSRDEKSFSTETPKEKATYLSKAVPVENGQAVRTFRRAKGKGKFRKPRNRMEMQGNFSDDESEPAPKTYANVVKTGAPSFSRAPNPTEIPYSVECVFRKHLDDNDVPAARRLYKRAVGQKEYYGFVVETEDQDHRFRRGAVSDLALSRVIVNMIQAYPTSVAHVSLEILSANYCTRPIYHKCDSLEEYQSYLFWESGERFGPKAKIAAFIAGSGLLIGSVIMIVKLFSSTIYPEAYKKGDAARQKTRDSWASQRAVKYGYNLHSDGIGSGSVEDLTELSISAGAIAKITSNLYGIYIGGIYKGSAVVYKGRQMSFCAHYLYSRSGSMHTDGTAIKLVREGIDSDIIFPLKHSELRFAYVTTGVREDIVILQLPQTVRTHKNIMSKIPDNDQLPKLSYSAESILLRVDDKGRIRIIPVTDVQVDTRIFKYSDHSGGIHDLCLTGRVTYTAATAGGDCDSLLLMQDTSQESRWFIAGSHRGRYVKTIGGSRSYSMRLTRELVQSLIDDVGTNNLESADVSAVVAKIGKHSFSGAEIAGLIDSSKKTHRPYKSKYRKSMIHNKVVKTKLNPPMLDPKTDPRLGGTDPVKSRIQSFNSLDYREDDKYLLIAKRELTRELIDIFRRNKTTLRKLTTVEAINGQEGKSSNSIDLNKSEGYPYVLDRPKTFRNKKWLFNTVDGKSYPTKESKEHLDRLRDQVSSGIVPEVIFTAHAKDEPVSDSKVASKKTRLFFGSPYDYHIVTWEYFKDFVDSVGEVRHELFSALGMNMYSPEYSQFMDRLLMNSNMGFSGDYKGMEETIRAQDMFHIKDIIDDVYRELDPNWTPTDSVARTALIEASAHNLLLFHTALLYVSGSMPSGTPITSFFEVMIQALFSRAAYLANGSVHGYGYSSYKENVVDNFLGDDSIYSVHPTVAHFFNQATLGAYVRKYGYIMTTSDKSLVLSTELVPVMTLDFLAVTPRVVPHNSIPGFKYMPVTRYSAHDKLMNWVTNDTPEQLFQNAMTSLRYRWFEGQFAYDTALETVRAAFLNEPALARFVSSLPSYDSHAARILGAPDWNIPYLENDQLPTGVRKIISAPMGSGKTTYSRANSSVIDLDDIYPYSHGLAKPLMAIPDMFKASNTHSSWKVSKRDGKIGLSAEIAPADCLVIIPSEVYSARIKQRPDIVSVVAQTTRASYIAYAKIHKIPIYESFPEAVLSFGGTIHLESADLGVTVDSESPPIAVGAAAEDQGQANGLELERVWNLSDMTRRRQFIGQYAWSLSNGVGDLLASWKSPWAFLDVPITATPFDRMTYLRTDVKLILTCKATQFHQGKALCYFLPLTPAGSNDSTYVMEHRPSQTMNPHVFLDPSVSTEISFTVPYRHWKTHLTATDRDFNDFLGTFNLVVFNTLKTGATTTEGAVINVYVEFVNSEFAIPSVAPVGGSFMEMQGNSVVKTTNINIDRVTDSTMGPMASADGFEAKNHVDPTVSASVPLGDGDANSNASSGADRKGGSNTKKSKNHKKGKKPMANDKPKIGLNPPPIVRRAIPYMTHAQNLEYADVLSYIPGEKDMHTPQSMHVLVDEMADVALMQRPIFSTTVEWSNQDVSGDVLWSDYISPCSELFSSVPGDLVDLTLFELVSARHTYWRGGLVYEFDIVSSKIHRGQLAFVINYGVFTDPADLQLSMAQYVDILDLSEEKRTYRIEVPYRSTRPMMLIPNGNPNRIEDYVTGRVSLRIVNDLRTMDSIASSVDINVFKSAAEDYEVFRPSSVNSTLELSYDTTGYMEMQSADGSTPEADPVVMTDPSIVAVGTSSAQIVAEPVVNPEYLHGIKDEMKRYFKIGTFTSNFQLDITDVFESNPSTPGLTFSKPGLIAYYASMYRYYTGSMRFMALYHGAGAGVVRLLYQLRPGTYGGTGDATDTTMGEFGDINAYDFSRGDAYYTCVEVPYVSLNPFTIIRKNSYSEPLDNAGYSGTLVGRCQEGVLTQEGTLFVSFGDMTRLACLYRVPRIKIGTNISPDTYTPGEVTFNIGQAITIQHLEGGPILDFTAQESVWAEVQDSDINHTPVLFHEAKVNFFSVNASLLTWEDLAFLGFAVDATTTIIVDPAGSETVSANLNGMYLVPSGGLRDYRSSSSGNVNIITALNFPSFVNMRGSSGSYNTQGPVHYAICNQGYSYNATQDYNVHSQISDPAIPQPTIGVWKPFWNPTTTLLITRPSQTTSPYIFMGPDPSNQITTQAGDLTAVGKT